MPNSIHAQLLQSPPGAARPSIRRKVNLVVGVVLFLLGVIAFVMWATTQNFQQTAERVSKSNEILQLGKELDRSVTEMESICLGFLITGEERSLNGYKLAQVVADEALEGLKVLTEDLPDQRERVKLLKLKFAHIQQIETQEIAARRTSGFREAATQFAESKVRNTMEELHMVASDLQRTEGLQLSERAGKANLAGRAAIIVTMVGTVATFLALIGAGFLIRRDADRRQLAEDALVQQANLLTSIMDAMPELVFVKDRQGHYVMQNRAHRLYLGLRISESIEGRTVFDLFPRELAERYHADDRYVIETGAPIRNREEPARPTSRNIVWLSTTKMPLRDPAGRIVGLVCVSADITARKEADEKLKRFAEQLERSNAELQSFASVASHDLQEPLRKIMAFGDRLRTRCGEALGEQGRDYLGRMQGAAERMQVLIQDLLKLSRITSRAQPFEPCWLTKIVNDVLGDLEVAIEEKSARVDVGDLPVIDADPLQMRQLFQNLIANALKFQQPGEAPVVSVHCEVSVSSGHEISGAPRGSKLCCIYVQDNGIGFDQKFADQIFDVFQRLHTRHQYEGTGIG
ncbi:MAG TPA: PAS domain-containing protein, partial [Chthoniobacteraceae bacterium]|nr:PAS domain-containing protein [Chthoniobacteraceae bacterium]